MSIFPSSSPGFYIDKEENANGDCLKVTVAIELKKIPFKNGTGLPPGHDSVITQSTTGYTAIIGSTTTFSGSWGAGTASGVFEVTSDISYPATGNWTFSSGTAVNNGVGESSQILRLWGLALFISIKDANNNYVVNRILSDLSNSKNLPDDKYDILYPGTNAVYYIPIPKGSSYKITLFAIPQITIDAYYLGVFTSTYTYTYNVNNLYYNSAKFYQEKGVTDTLLNVGDYNTFYNYWNLAYPVAPNDANAWKVEETGIMGQIDTSIYSKKDKFVISAQCCAVNKIVELIRLRIQGDQAFSYKMHEVMSLISYILALKDLDNDNDCLTDEEINILIERAERICCSCC